MSFSIPHSSANPLPDLIRFYSSWVNTQSLTAEVLERDITLGRDELKKIKEREIEVLKKGSHNPYTPWVYGAATVAAISAFFFLSNPITIGAVVSTIALAGSFYQIAYTGNGLLLEQRRLDAQAKQKVLNAAHFLTQKKIEQETSYTFSCIESVRTTTEILRRIIASQN